MIRLIDDNGRDKEFSKEVAEDALYKSSIKDNLSWKLPDDADHEFKNGELIAKKKASKGSKPPKVQKSEEESDSEE